MTGAPLTKRQIALVHVAKARLGLNEEDYRELLARFGQGARSSKELTQGQLEELLQHFKKCGFEVPSFRPLSKGAPNIRRLPAAKHAGLAAVDRALANLNLPWVYAEGIARQMFGIKKLQWLAPEQLQKVRLALEYQLGRKK